MKQQAFQPIGVVEGTFVAKKKKKVDALRGGEQNLREIAPSCLTGAVSDDTIT